jgi:hypothetical protein
VRRYTFAALLVILVLSVTGMAACQEQPEPDQSNASAEYTTTSMCIPGIPPLQWGKGMDCTFFGALTHALRYLDEHVSYEYLMGMSGAAFATRFHTDWSAKSPDAALSGDHPSAALRAVGYAYEWSGLDLNESPGLIMASIERNMPVIGNQLTGTGDWGLVVGYEFMGEVWFCRTYRDKSTGYTRVPKTPQNMLVLKEKIEPPPWSESVRKSLKLAVEFAKDGHKLPDPKYQVGLKAFDAWNQALRDKSKLGTGKEQERTMHINAWIYGSLLDARKAGVSYLRWAAKQLDGDVRKSVEEAADSYDEEVDLLDSGKKCAPYPHQVKSEPKWTDGMREDQIAILEQAVEKEKLAIASLEKALAALDAPQQ